jgi:PAS domain S-box-containing protein
MNVNQAGAELTGFAKDQLMRMTIFDLCHPQEQHRLMNDMKALMNGTRLGDREVSIVRRDSLIRIIAHTSKVVTYGGQRVIQSVMRDVTDLKLSAQKERATIFYNLHDHMGSAISDLNIQFNSLSTEIPPSKEELDSIQFSLRGIDDNLRMQINAFQDRKILEADFFNGLRIILFRRYAICKREIHIYLNEINSSDSNLFKNQIMVWNLYSLCMEFCNNDLKYGYGTCKWSWEKKKII